ncbi:hypothetical protein B0H14DRAFT_3885212 [Mycena olivaceomarginata]|nr:hypothetical protein B0H14DRAFT_3885212 [Mycena olivaceomarginata]
MAARQTQCLKEGQSGRVCGCRRMGRVPQALADAGGGGEGRERMKARAAQIRRRKGKEWGPEVGRAAGGGERKDTNNQARHGEDNGGYRVGTHMCACTGVRAILAAPVSDMASSLSRGSCHASSQDSLQAALQDQGKDARARRTGEVGKA